MPSYRRGSPFGDILLFGTCLSLALPIAPAFAAPDPLPDWGVASKPAKVEPAPAAAPPPVAEAAVGASAEPDPVIEPDAAEPAPVIEPDPQPAAPRRKPSKPRAKKKPKPQVVAVQPAPAPVVPLAPAEPDAAIRRKGNGELIAGALLASGGLASFGVMAGGLYLNRLSERELAKGEGRPAEDLAPLHDQQRRAETMIAAGAIAGAAGLALGVALLAIGARDLKAARREPLSARLRVAPTIGGLVLAGRF
jgi:hypothetical protein